MIDYTGSDASMRLLALDYNNKLSALLRRPDDRATSAASFALLCTAVQGLLSIIRKYNPREVNVSPDEEQWFRHIGRQNFLDECNTLSGLILRIETTGIDGLSQENRSKFFVVKAALMYEIPGNIRKIPDMRIQVRTSTPPPETPTEAFSRVRQHVDEKESFCTWLCRKCGCVIL